ncbi:hypothetical protein SteCoe_11215 [Stentor coeruleus]|uniref:Arf-GAP domain-containing protein n=1 Tax=Stentor coeruleus TaxID=5963 RepID=A0A1R2CDV0_9CILI|nr:hypothetical protein SteCoe_11215 [Stentor coeruleus]
MVSSENSAQIFNNLRSDPENNKCIECNRMSPTFASVNNGCFICVSCVQSHLPLGAPISRVKVLDDIWTQEDLQLMIAGGNSSLKEFFAHYNILNTPPNFKYLTRASFFYREMLSVIAQDREYDHSCPSIEDGVQLAGSVYPDLPDMPSAPLPNTNVEESKMTNIETGTQKKSAWQWAKGAYSKAVDYGNKTADKLSDKINKFAEKPSIKVVEDKTLHYAGKLESGLNNLINKVSSKPAVQSTVSQINQAADSFANEVRYNYTKINSNPSVQKLKLDTMNMLKDIASSFKNSPPPPV